MLLIFSLLGSVVGRGANASQDLIRVALVSVVVVGVAPLLSFTVTSELLDNSEAFLTAASQVATFVGCLAFTLLLTSSGDVEVPLWRVAEELGMFVSVENPFSLVCFGLCSLVGRGAGSNLGSFWSGRWRRV